MKIIKRCGTEVVFDIDKIVAAVGKAALRDSEDDVNRRIDEIESILGNANIYVDIIYRNVCTCILDEYNELLAKKENVKAQLRAKVQQIRMMIKVFWLNRNQTAGRCNTNSVSDQMLMSIPTPPTSIAIINSFGCGGVIIAPVSWEK